MDTMRPAALLSWERTWADGAVLRGRGAGEGAAAGTGAAVGGGGGGAVEGGRHPRLRAVGGVAVARDDGTAHERDIPMRKTNPSREVDV